MSVHGVTLGAVPALPLLAALPDTQAVPLIAFVSQAIPAIAGLVAGPDGRALVRRRGRRSVVAGLTGLLAGVLLGVVSGLLVWVAGGSLGDGALAEVGAPALATGHRGRRAGRDRRRDRGRRAPAGGRWADAGPRWPEARRRLGSVEPCPRRARRPDPRARVVVLLSGTGSLCAALLAATDDPAYPAAVVAVGSDRRRRRVSSTPAAGACRPSSAPSPTIPTAAAWDRALAAELAAVEPDLVVCAGFMKIVGPAVLDAFGGRLINTHPALLPAFPGAHAVRDALAAGVTVTGATVHVVDAGVDTGPVLAQREVAVLPGDDEARLHERIKDVERELLVQTVAQLAPPTDHERGRAPDERPHPHPPRAARRLRQDRHRGAGRRPRRGRRRAGEHRRHRAPDRRRRHPGHAGRAGHRLPGVPGRPGEDAAPRRARRDPGRPAQARPRRASSRSWASRRSTWWW